MSTATSSSPPSPRSVLTRNRVEDAATSVPRPCSVYWITCPGSRQLSRRLVMPRLTGCGTAVPQPRPTGP